MYVGLKDFSFEDYPKTTARIDVKIKDLAASGKDETKKAKVLIAEEESMLVRQWNLNTPMGLLSFVYYFISEIGAFHGRDAYMYKVVMYSNLKSC
jgi:hypothetical protein